jgi:hypothetical protein
MRGPSKVVFSGSPEYMAYVDHGAEVYDQDGHLDVSLTALLNVQFYDAMGVCRYSYVQSRGHRAMSEYTFVDQCVLVRYSLCVDGNYISAERPFTFMSVLKAPVITDRKVV